MICLTEESSHSKKFDLKQLLAQKYKKQIRNNSQFSLNQITQRDYYHPSYLPARSPPNLQFQNWNNSVKSNNSKKTQFSKQITKKCKTLPINDLNQQEIFKKIDFKQNVQPKISQVKNRSITCKIPVSTQFKIIQVELSSQSPQFQIKDQEIYTPKRPQSRLNSSFQKYKKICLAKPSYGLGLKVEKCKILDRLKTISSSPQNKPFKIKIFKSSIPQDKQQRPIIYTPKIQVLNFKKKSSIQLTKWEYSDLEND
ncbi:unnamed protein product [Paramecium sonneborni]|uniref:Uncharacterized protein n=1 Tax=Paramecium sonneborni TaxID=65129 RepID=A0A8S1NLU3_9CILI|nr:unnamed protein product [Paramecium sonneborni]CAD8091408.1 unnamed protein product [Paramecium sonneborni]